jgi:phytoene dehydrogenase-like protein
MTGIKDFKDRIVSKTVVGPNDFKNNYNSWQSTALGPAHTLKQSAFLRTGNKSKKVSNLYYAGGSTIPGIGLPMCLISAELVYKHIVNDKSGGPIKDIKKVV